MTALYEKNTFKPGSIGDTDHISENSSDLSPSMPKPTKKQRRAARRASHITLEAFNAVHKIKIPSYTLSEELLNAISHGVAGLLAIAALVLCVVRGVYHENPWAVVSGAIYGASLFILYSMSTLYHSLAVNRAKLVFRVIDHCSIFLLIAGTYTPYTLVSLRAYIKPLAWTIFGVVWAAAVVGITLAAIDVQKFHRTTQFMYIITGCVIILAIYPMSKCVALPGIVLLLVGGFLYIAGSVFYALGKQHRYMHSIFHFFVVAASILHFFSILFYVM